MWQRAAGAPERQARFPRVGCCQSRLLKNNQTLTNARIVWGDAGGEMEGGRSGGGGWRRTVTTTGGESKEVEFTGI